MITITMLICTTILICKDKLEDAPIGAATLVCGILDCILASIIL